MRSIRRPATPGKAAPTHVIWLPGAFQEPEMFLDAGFDARARARNLALDLEFVQIELEHVGDRRAVERLEREIVAPARRGGASSVWLAGISLGGFFALDYAATHPGGLDGVCVLAPYLGSRMLLAEIAAAPDLAAWRPGPLAQSDEERRIWRFIQSHRAGGPPLLLGYGRDDRFAQAHRLMAAALAADAVHVVPGGHDWPTWSILWERVLESIPG